MESEKNADSPLSVLPALTDQQWEGVDLGLFEVKLGKAVGFDDLKAWLKPYEPSLTDPTVSPSTIHLSFLAKADLTMLRAQGEDEAIDAILAAIETLRHDPLTSPLAGYRTIRRKMVLGHSIFYVASIGASASEVTDIDIIRVYGPDHTQGVGKTQEADEDGPSV